MTAIAMASVVSGAAALAFSQDTLGAAGEALRTAVLPLADAIVHPAIAAPLVTAVFSGIVVRGGLLRLPPAESRWEWTSADQSWPIRLMKDSAGTAGNAAADIWAAAAWGSSVRIQMCAEHVKGRWMAFHKKHGESPATWDENKKKMESDCDAYKECPLLLLVSGKLLFDLMMTKWRNLGEATVAQKFSQTWREFHSYTRVEVNQGGPVAGGAPADNNAIERSNGVQKKLGAGKSMSLLEYLTRNYLPSMNLIGYIEWRSQACAIELEFGTRYNTKYCLNTAMLQRVWDRISSPVSPLTVCFEMRGGKGKILIASQRLINDLRSGKYGTPPLETAAAFKKAVNQKGEGTSRSWLSLFVSLYNEPSKLVGKHPEFMTFDSVIEYASAFYILSPILHALFITRVHERLTAHGFGIVPLAALIASTPYSCSCSTYLHYQMCHHVVEDMWRRKLIFNWPKHMAPTRLEPVRTQKGTQWQGLCGD
jgi:hypothetical protein